MANLVTVAEEIELSKVTDCDSAPDPVLSGRECSRSPRGGTLAEVDISPFGCILKGSKTEEEEGRECYNPGSKTSFSTTFTPSALAYVAILPVSKRTVGNREARGTGEGRLPQPQCLPPYEGGPAALPLVVLRRRCPCVPRARAGSEARLGLFRPRVVEGCSLISVSDHKLFIHGRRVASL